MANLSSSPEPSSPEKLAPRKGPYGKHTTYGRVLVESESREQVSTATKGVTESPTDEKATQWHQTARHGAHGPGVQKMPPTDYQ